MLYLIATALHYIQFKIAQKQLKIRYMEKNRIFFNHLNASREVLRWKQRHAEDQQNLNVTSLLVGTNHLKITVTFKSHNKLINFQRKPSYTSILADKNHIRQFQKKHQTQTHRK